MGFRKVSHKEKQHRKEKLHMEKRRKGNHRDLGWEACLDNLHRQEHRNLGKEQLQRRHERENDACDGGGEDDQADPWVWVAMLDEYQAPGLCPSWPSCQLACSFVHSSWASVCAWQALAS